MDLVERLESGLEPLGGPLLLDRFLEALAAARAREEAAAATAPEPGEPDVAGPPAPARAGRQGGGMEMEIEEFLNRDATEGTSDDEIQEFLKDRRGFDPDDAP